MIDDSITKKITLQQRIYVTNMKRKYTKSEITRANTRITRTDAGKAKQYRVNNITWSMYVLPL